MPITRTTKVERLRYMTDPLPYDITVAGPISLTLYAAIDQDDTNWIIVLKDVGPDVSVRTAREGDYVYLRTAAPIAANGQIVVPEGSYVQGVVTQSVRSGRVKGKAQLAISIDTMTLAKRPTEVRLDPNMVEAFKKQVMIAQTLQPK